MEPHSQAIAGAAQFRTTRWSMVMRAGAEQLSQTNEQRALEELCRAYWYPLYSVIRRRGHSPHGAEDLTQAFFARLLEKGAFAMADRERGRFRTFLLSALNNFLTSEWERMQAAKRGGGVELLSLDAALAEERFTNEPATFETPERAFDRRWVETLLANVLARLRTEAEQAGELERFERLKVFLVEDRGATSFAEMAAALGTTEAGVKGVVRRMRGRYRELLRQEVANTVASPDQIESELRHLIAST